MDKSGLQTSLWAATATPPPSTEKLAGVHRAAVLIIGGGFTGCSTALHLAKAGTAVAVLEGSDIGFGASGRNVGMVNAAVSLNPKEVLRRLPAPFGERLLDGLAASPALVRALAAEHDIECNIGKRGIAKVAHSRAGMRGVRETVAQWQARGAQIDLLTPEEVTRATGTAHSFGGMIDHRNFTLQPLSYVRGLGAAAIGAGARIFTQSRVLGLSRVGTNWVARTALGSVIAQKALICTGAYSTDLIPGMTRSFTPAGCFMLATVPLSEEMRRFALPNDDSSFIDSQHAVQFARYDRTHRLIIGTLGWLPEGGAGERWARKALRHFFRQLPKVEFDFLWTGNIDLTDDHLPWLSKPQANLYAIGGFNGRGIGAGTYWGGVLSAWLQGMPEDELPLPVEPMPYIQFRQVKQTFYSNAFRVTRLLNRFR
jgi:glycine/D-amino acid oxidase-like deaminating enzyme